MPRAATKISELQRWLGQHQPEQITEQIFGELLQVLAPISPSYLRSLLRNTAIPLAPLVEGVRISEPAELERTLTALSAVYAEGDRESRNRARALVLEAKMRARRHSNEETQLWIQTWLENPVPFPTWLALRKRTLPPDQDRT